MDNKDKLIEKLEEYIELLGDELNSTSVLAWLHGWRSKRVEQGEKLREEIEQLKKQYQQDKGNPKSN